MHNRVVVTGLGVISSIGIGKDAFWNNLIQGVSGISEVTGFNTSNHTTHVGGEVKNFNPTDFMAHNQTKLVGRASQMAIAATKLAFSDAHLDKESLSQLKTSVCLGTTMGEIDSFERVSREWFNSKGCKLSNEFLLQSPVHNISSSVSKEFKAQARSRIFSTACAAGNYAIGYGHDLLRLNKADLVIAGGADAFSWIAFTGFNKIGATAPKMCQPFDKNRKGMIPAEGAGILVLETLENALSRKAPIYAEILGYGLSCDAYHMTNPQAGGIAECMKKALYDSQISERDVDYINAHGTGTVYNDRAECAAIKQVLGGRRIPISSTKSMLGHTMGSASAIEAISCCLSLKHDIIPPTINFQTPDPECDIDCVPNNAIYQTVNIALNNAFGFGGNNSCLVLKKFTN